MERPVVALLLAVVGGVLSGFTFYTVQLFSTVQSGNVVQAGYQIAAHGGVRWQHAVLAILSFGIGSAATAVIENVLIRFQFDYSYVVLFIEAAVLILMGFSFVHEHWSPLAYAYVVSFLAGMQGNAFHRVDGFLYGNVAVTLVLQQAFNHLVQGLFGNRRVHLLQSGLFFIVLLGFAAGGYIGAWGTREYEQRILWLPAALLALLGAWGFIRQARAEPVDIPIG
jgi:uncharacterized membrane protein YoaK (UPF0700 family)